MHINLSLLVLRDIDLIKIIVWGIIVYDYIP